MRQNASRYWNTWGLKPWQTIWAFLSGTIFAKQERPTNICGFSEFTATACKSSHHQAMPVVCAD